MTDHWFTSHFADVDDINPIHLRRTAAIRLVQMSTGGSQAEAGQLLDIPTGRTGSSTFPVRRWTLAPHNQARLTAAVRDFADQLNNAATPTDYSKRRAAMRDWTLPADDWASIYRQLPMPRKHAQDSDRHLRLASALVWRQVTDGDYRLSPLAASEHHKASRTNGNRLLYDIQQSSHSIRRSPNGYTATLSHLLTRYAHDLAAKIDQEEHP